MNLQEYLNKAHTRYLINHSRERVGQAYFNALLELEPHFYDHLSADQRRIFDTLDPFYNDSNLGGWLTWLAEILPRL